MVNAVVNGAVPKFVSQAPARGAGARFAKIAAAVGQARRQAQQALERSQRQIEQRRRQIDEREQAELAQIDQRRREQLDPRLSGSASRGQQRLRALGIHLGALCAPGRAAGAAAAPGGRLLLAGGAFPWVCALTPARDGRVRALLREAGRPSAAPDRAPVVISPAAGASAAILTDARSAAERRKLSGLVRQSDPPVRPAGARNCSG